MRQKWFLFASGGLDLSQRGSCEINTSSVILCRLTLTAIWFFGLICGVFLFLHTEHSILPMMRSIPFGSVSIVTLFLAGLVPFLFTAYAVCFSQPWLVICMGFCNSCLLSFVTTGITVTFTTAGWLMCDLLLFANYIGCSILIFLWLKKLIN